MLNFAAIDFETANWERTSICSVGVVVVRDGKVAEQFYSLIRPQPNWYHWRNTQIHGITFEDTRNESLFPNVWTEVAALIKELPLVAHNYSFDEGCLRATMAHYGMAYPTYRFECTLRASRRAMPGLANHQLHTVAEAIGFDLRDHHNALADAIACAHIALAII